MVRLLAVGWDHERCMAPMRAAAVQWARLYPKIEVEWHPRPGLSFAEQPLEEVAPSFDLLSIDHPFVGAASVSRCLVPLDELLSAEELETLGADAIGPSHASYAYGGRQWALATDAACLVSVVRDDLLSSSPRTWDEVIELGREAPGRVTTSLEAHGTICAFLTLCANAWGPVLATPERLADPETGRRAIEWLLAFARVCHPGAWDDFIPERMSRTDDCLYSPLQFGYTNYCRPGSPGRHLRFVDIPSAGLGP